MFIFVDSIYTLHGNWLTTNGRTSVTILLSDSVADLGFPRGGGANSPGGAPTYDFAKFSQKLHEIERIWTPGGGGGTRPKFYYVDPPLRFKHVRSFPNYSQYFRLNWAWNIDAFRNRFVLICFEDFWGWVQQNYSTSWIRYWFCNHVMGICSGGFRISLTRKGFQPKGGVTSLLFVNLTQKLHEN